MDNYFDLEYYCESIHLNSPVYESWIDNDKKWYSTVMVELNENHKLFEETVEGFRKKRQSEEDVSKLMLNRLLELKKKEKRCNNILIFDLNTHCKNIEIYDDSNLYIGFLNKNCSNFRRKYKRIIKKYGWNRIYSLDIEENHNKYGNKLLYVIDNKVNDFMVSYFICSMLYRLDSYRNINIDFYCNGSEYLYDIVYNLI
jgi:hypothetical protein